MCSNDAANIEAVSGDFDGQPRSLGLLAYSMSLIVVLMALFLESKDASKLELLLQSHSGIGYQRNSIFLVLGTLLSI